VTWDELLSWYSAQEHLRELAAGMGRDELHPSSAAATRLVAALDADADPEALAELAEAADPGPWRAAVEAELGPRIRAVTVARSLGDKVVARAGSQLVG
jgi:hypothetical protein